MRGLLVCLSVLAFSVAQADDDHKSQKKTRYLSDWAVTSETMEAAASAFPDAPQFVSQQPDPPEKKEFEEKIKNVEDAIKNKDYAGLAKKINSPVKKDRDQYLGVLAAGLKKGAYPPAEVKKIIEAVVKDLVDNKGVKQATADGIGRWIKESLEEVTGKKIE